MCKAKTKTKTVMCKECVGTGIVHDMHDDMWGNTTQITYSCEYCLGSGKVTLHTRKCTKCSKVEWTDSEGTVCMDCNIKEILEEHMV